MAIDLDIQKKLGDFHLDIKINTDSKRIGILGASGCGKSMTLKCIAGIEKPDSGHIHLDGRELFHREKKVNPKPQKRKVGYLFQNYALFPTMTVKENIAVGIHAAKKETQENVNYYMKKFQLDGLENHYPSQLSGGQQQRVALARIMASEPETILLDEPFSAMDVYLKDRLQHELLSMLEDFKGTVIMVSHNRDEIYRFSDTLVIMDQGKTIISGDTKSIFNDPKKKEAARLTGCKNIIPVEWKSDHEIYVPDWNVSFTLQKKIGEEIHFIGIRAHEFIPSWDGIGRNGIPVKECRYEELPFERKYFIKSIPDQKEEICWFVQRDLWKTLDEKDFPEYLYLPENEILLLE